MSSDNQDEPSTSTAGAIVYGGAPANTNNPNLLFARYEVGRLLGYGGFAKVYYARDTRSGQSVAIKIISKSKIEKSNLAAHVKREVAIMRRLRHPHIIRLWEVLATRSKIYFIMEFAKGGELFAKIARGRFSEDLSRRYFQQLISAVDYCHSRGVYHRDLKPENLLLDENFSLKVSDFGLSAIREQTRPEHNPILQTLCGTPAYVAPEILAKKGYDGTKADVWSCGVILFVLNAGFLPFNDTNLIQLYRKIYKGEFRCPKWMSQDLRRLLGRILDTNPDTRISINEIVHDPWFKKGGYKEVSYLKMKDENDHHNVGEEEDSRRFLTAFDLISFSPGFDLTGLFVGVEKGRFNETYLSKEGVETVVERVEMEARGIHAPRVEVERVKGGMGVRVEGQNGNFGLVVLVHRLTEELVVVEVKLKEKDLGPSLDFWKEKLRPKICHLFYQPVQPDSLPDPQLDPDPNSDLDP